MLGASAHRGFHGGRLGGHGFALQIVENPDKDVTFHLAKLRVIRSEPDHGHRRFIRLVQIPLRGMIGHKAGMIPRQPVHDPVRRGHVRVIVGSVNSLRSFLIPAGPAPPVQVAAIVAGGQLVGLIVEEALADAVLLWPILILELPPKNAVDELLELRHFLGIGIPELLHSQSQP